MVARPQDLSRRSAVLAGWSGDEPVARDLMGSDDEKLRASALAALARMGAISISDLLEAFADTSPVVRCRALLLLPPLWTTEVGAAVSLVALLDDPEPVVLEVACFVAGECEPTQPGVVERLAEICVGHAEVLCRESAVAALGSLGDQAGMNAVLAACTDKATVRRRAVLALAAFEGGDVDAMLGQMTDDVDWQVRQAAEELVAIE